MEIHIKIVGPRWLRLPRRRSLRLGLVLVAALVVAVPVAWANHTFADVPNASPHHADVTSIKIAGITQGCNPPANTLYCPSDPVRRDQMASFLQRGLGRAGRVHVSTSGITTAESVAATVTVTTPGAGFVLVNAAGEPNCSCVMRMRLRSATTNEFSFYTGGTSTGAVTAAMTMTYLFPIPAAGTHSFEIRAHVTSGTHAIFVEANALWVPFGSTGSSTLSTEAETRAARQLHG